MDTIVYPADRYCNSALLFALTQPVYLTSSQVDFLVDSVEHPANGSEQTRAEFGFLLSLLRKRSDA